MNWLYRTDTLIIPVLENNKIPNSTFSVARNLITIDWNKSFVRKNLNKSVFPNIHTVLMLDSNKNKNRPQHSEFKILTGFEEEIIKDDCILWNKTYVNKEWLESQYHEYICAMQEYHQLRENELH